MVALFGALLVTLLFFFGMAAMTGVQISALPRVLPWLPVIFPDLSAAVRAIWLPTRSVAT
ncbi:MAG: hypothetical protein R3E79_26515 [Caldilineaceae bacterium]